MMWQGDMQEQRELMDQDLVKEILLKTGTDRLIVRGIEQAGIDNSSVLLLGYRSDNVRGNKINGIRDKNSVKGKLYMRSAEKKT